MPFDYVPLTASEAPPIKTGTQRYLITYEDISALLVDNLENRGLIECPFALAVNQRQKGKSVPIMIIAAEYNPMESLLFNDTFGGTNEGITHSDTKKYYLDVYDRNEHSTYGIIEPSDDIQVFKSKAVAIMKERCGITGDVREFDIEKLKKESDNRHKITELTKKILQLGEVPKQNKEEIIELCKKIQKLDANEIFGSEIGKKIEKILEMIEVL